MDTIGNSFHQICRTCMIQDQNFHSIFECGNNPLNIHEMLSTTIPQLLIINGDQLPQQICVACLSKLNIAYGFQQMCISSEKKLRSTLSESLDCDAMCSEVDPLLGEVQECIKIEEDEEELKQFLFEKLDHCQSTDDLLSKEDRSLDDDSFNSDTPRSESGGRSKDFEKSSLMRIQTRRQCEKMREKLSSSAQNEIEKPNLKNRRKEKFPCLDCKMVFDRPYRLKRHAVLHSPTRPFSCGLCNYRFTSLGQMRRHKLIHAESTQLPSLPPPEGYKCNECPRRFEKRESLSAHIQSHRKLNRIQMFKCDFSSKTYRNLSNLATHAGKHTENHKIKCTLCNKAFEWNSQSTHHTVKPHVCDVCHSDSHVKELSEFPSEKLEHTQSTDSLLGRSLDKDSSNSDTTKTENGGRFKDLEDTSSTRIQTRRKCKVIREERSSSIQNETGVIEIEKPNLKNRRKGKFPCLECKKVFDRPYRLKRHAVLHSPTRQFLCDFCNYRFSTLSHLTKHKLVHAGSTPLPSLPPPEGYQCNECPRRFEKRESLAAHIQSHRKLDRIQMFKCDFCPKKYRNISSLARHAAKHPENQEFKCILCNEAFGMNAQFIEHVNKHKALEPFVCVHCNKAFSKNSKLKEHQCIHTGEKSLLCPQCGKSFQSASNMRQHLMRHSGEKRYQCPECPSKFACQSDKIKHMSTHRAVKPHVCDICGSSFTRSYSLTKHKHIHTGVRPYKCEECQMTFVFVEHMRRHKRTHTGERPYKCKFCDRAYSESGDLNKHLRSHMGEKIYMCDQCPEAFKYQQELREHQRLHFKQQQESKELDKVKVEM